MKKYMKILLPIALVVGALAVVTVLFLSRPKAERHTVAIKEPMVSVTTVNPQNLKIPVFTRGTVTPGTEIPLVSEVSGPVTFVSENFARGGFFKKGEVLIKVDPVEYEVTLKKASAAVAQALQLLEQANAEKRVRSAVKGVTSELGRFEYQYQQAKAQHDAARAELEAVNLQKRKTIIVAPFDGRVRMGGVNPGQYLRPGVQLGLIYAVNAAEVRLPLSDNQLALVDVPFRFGTQGVEGPSVTLVGDYGGKKFYWQGQVVRAESGVDEYNRLLYVIAQIPDPYAIDVAQPDRPPLTAGNFVEAQIDGRGFEGLFVVPRQALRQGAQVWTVNAENRLERKPVEILYKGKDVVYVKSGLASGDNVVLSQLDIAVEGMKVRSSVVPQTNNQENINPNNLLDDGIQNSGGMFQPKGADAAALEPESAKAETAKPETAKPSANAAAKLDALNKKVDQAKQAWENASVTEKAAAVNQARQTLTTLTEQVKQSAPAAAAAVKAAPTAAEQAKAAISPLADLINETESQMKQTVQAAKTAPVTSAPAASAAVTAPVESAPAPKGYITIPVSAPKTMSEAAQ
jgi:RND family efflux transporter MFP subunit